MGRTPSTTHRRHFCRALYLLPSNQKLFPLIRQTSAVANKKYRQWMYPLTVFLFDYAPILRMACRRLRLRLLSMLAVAPQQMEACRALLELMPEAAKAAHAKHARRCTSDH